jgi:glycosyltransferase involved in cell wall biosynthesis
MKINFILPFYSNRPIGGFKVVYGYANELAGFGHEVALIHPRSIRNVATPRGALRRLQNAALDARNAFAPRPGLKWQPLDRRVRVLIVPEPTSQYVPDCEAVFATAWQTSEYVHDYPPRKGKKFYLVMDFDPWIAPKAVLEKTWRYPMIKVTISNWLRNRVLSAGTPTSEVINIPIGINFDQFRMINDIGGRAQRILMLHSHSPSKGSDIGIAAIAKYREAHPDVEVDLFGATARRRPAGLPTWARYHGIVSNERLLRLYNESRIYVCSSWAEGFALPPAEAMACGCAIAATDCGGIREFALDGINALLSPPGDAERLALNIIRLLDDDELRRSLASTGCNLIRRFTWATAAARLEALIERQVMPQTPTHTLVAHA